MTNAKYHRCRRALERLERLDGRGLLPIRSDFERARLRRIVNEYQRGGLRAKNGRGVGLHTSGARA